MHLPRFWKHKETKEVIDHLTYSDLKAESSDFEECDVTGELLSDIEKKDREFLDNLNKEPGVANEDVVISEDTKDVN